MRTERTVPLPPIRLRAEVAPTDTAKRRAQATIYAGATMPRLDAWDGHYALTLAMDGADLSRFNSGAAVTRDHSDDLDAVVGVIERAWISGGQALATLRFSDREEVATLWADIQSGVVRNVSMDVALTEVRDVTKKNGPKALLATKWLPLRLAIVSAGADPGAQLVALSNHPTHPCVIRGETLMSDDLDTTTDDATELEKLEAKAAKLEAKRRARIDQLADEEPRGFGCGDVWARKMYTSDHSDGELVRLASADRVRRDQTPHISSVGLVFDHDSPGARLSMMADGLSARAANAEPTDRGRRFYNSTIAELALECLAFHGRQHGLDARRDRAEIIRLGLHTTSDFPLLMGNVLNKGLLPAYESMSPTFQAIAAQKTFNDFRPQRFIRAGDFPVPLRVGEGGEITHGTMGDSQETLTLATFARIFSISRQALINDDLSAFATLPEMAARRVSDFHNSVFFSTCITAGSGLGPALADGVAVYNATHANLTASGALSNALLGEALTLMMNQTSGPTDGLKLNVQPRYLLVSPASYTLARTLLAAITPAQASQVNPFAGEMIALADANLSGTRFYALSDPARLAQYVYGTLDGQGPLRFEVRAGFEVEGIDAKVATDFACGAVEHRAGVSGAGA